MLGLGNSLTGGTALSNFTNYSVSFNGSDDFMIITEADALKPTAAISISLWAKPNAWDMTGGGDTDVILGCLSSGGFRIYLNNTGGNATTLNFQIRVDDTGSGSAGYITATVNEATTEAFSGWKNITATYDGTTAKLYVNGGTSGVTNATSASGAAIAYHGSSHRPIMIGADAGGNDTTGENFYHGLVDDVAVWNDDLSAAEVTAVYNNGVPFDLTANKGDYASKGDLVGYWIFEEGSGTSIADSSTNSNTGGAGNAWSWSTDIPE